MITKENYISASFIDNDRKNIENMIKWFCQEFNCDENVGLILKTNSGRCSLADRKVTI